MAGDQHVKAYQLPLEEAFGLLYVAEWVAFEGFLALGPDFAKLAVFALNHNVIFTQKVVAAFLIYSGAGL